MENELDTKYVASRALSVMREQIAEPDGDADSFRLTLVTATTGKSRTRSRALVGAVAAALLIGGVLAASAISLGDPDVPTAAASPDDDGVDAAIDSGTGFYPDEPPPGLEFMFATLVDGDPLIRYQFAEHMVISCPKVCDGPWVEFAVVDAPGQRIHLAFNTLEKTTGQPSSPLPPDIAAFFQRATFVLGMPDWVPDALARANGG